MRISDRDNFCLSKSEFNDAIAMRYGLPLKALPSKCDGCGSAFDLPHALSCKKGGLISLRHNEVRDVLGDLSSLAWSNVQKEPLIREHSNEQPALRADLLVRGVWSYQDTASFDIRVTDTEAKSYNNKSSKAVLMQCEEEKKKKYSQACAEKHISFTPLVFSVDGLIGTECQVFLKRLAERLASKWDKPYGQTISWIRTRVSFAVLRATNLCIRGTRCKWSSFQYQDGGFVPSY